MSKDEIQIGSLGMSIGCLLLLAVGFLAMIAGTAFAIWWNYNLAVPLENSNRHVATCSMQYLVTQKSRISNDLDAISNTNSEIADPNYASAKIQLHAQEKQNARDIYNALDASQCSRPQILKDMPELQDFFQQFPAR